MDARMAKNRWPPELLKPRWVKNVSAMSFRGRIEVVLDYAKGYGWRSGQNPARWKGHLDHLLPRRQKIERAHHAAMPYADLPIFVTKLDAARRWEARLFMM